ncbi:mas-related G-protein coupled receptor member H-like [Alligator mississippiensis]|uniref:Mas-related G-protein coupled receptor member H-like n=1 Tax=Alligator mississippiensis TaxID=8496 RepID=A0A151MUA2_ALLMI|nr:mas-related G-protein coupled receptor member H-like [Alligator mississippiensis]
MQVLGWGGDCGPQVLKRKKGLCTGEGGPANVSRDFMMVGSYTNRQFKASISTAFQRVFEDTTDSTTQRSSVNRLSGETATEISDSTQSETLTSRDRISSRL